MGRFRTALFLLCLAFAFATAPSSTRAVDDEIPTCEEVGTCVVFDPPAAAPGTTVTITPDPVTSDGSIFIMAECPPEGRLRMELDTATTSFSSPLVGDDQLARFTVPDAPPGEYDAVVFCPAINLGMGVGVFRVLAVEAPQGTPTPTPEATPTPAGTPTPLPTPTPRPHGGVIDVYKIIDADGNLDTVDDQTAGEGWEYELELTGGTIVDAFPVTDESGFAEFLIEFDGEGPTATVSEALQEDFELIAASCFTFHGPEEGEVIVGELDGDSVTFRLDAREFPYICNFYNAPSTSTPDGGEIAVDKVIDADGNIDTTDDQTWVPGWEFELELTDGAIEQVFPDVSAWLISFGPGGTTATVTEVVQGKDFELFAVSCFKGNDPLQPGSEFVVELDGDSVTFQVDPDFAIIECFFYNAPSPAGSVGGETATPPSNTLPPTDSGGPTSSPTSGSWLEMLVVLAGILAGGVVLKSRRAAGQSIA
jgi:hypothetical protein